MVSTPWGGDMELQLKKLKIYGEISRLAARGFIKIAINSLHHCPERWSNTYRSEWRKIYESVFLRAERSVEYMGLRKLATAYSFTDSKLELHSTRVPHSIEVSLTTTI